MMVEGFAWQAQGIVNLAESEQNVRVLQQCQLQPPLQLQLQLQHTTNTITLRSTTLH